MVSQERKLREDERCKGGMCEPLRVHCKPVSQPCIHVPQTLCQPSELTQCSCTHSHSPLTCSYELVMYRCQRRHSFPSDIWKASKMAFFTTSESQQGERGVVQCWSATNIFANTFTSKQTSRLLRAEVTM